jgi:membrane associated rhomboid family serine protease
MAVADRQYMRDAYHPPRVTTILIVVLIVAFVIQSIFLHYRGINFMGDFGLTGDGLRHGKVWQLLTFQFLHLGPMPWHVLGNCLGLFFFGRRVEEILGARRFLLLYFASGVTGGLVQVASLVLPNHLDIPVVGASAGVCGLIAMFCTLHPMQELTAWIYFFPITVRARWFLVFVGLISLYGTLVPFNGMAHGAHLGGVLFGMGFAYWGASFAAKFNFDFFHRRRRRKELVRVATRGRPWREPGHQPAPDVPDEHFISRKIDPILDKISTHGIHSLTERERRLLESARKKLKAG